MPKISCKNIHITVYVTSLCQVMVDPHGLSARYTFLKHLPIIYKNVHGYLTSEWYHESLQSPERFLAISGLSGEFVTPFVTRDDKRFKLLMVIEIHWLELRRLRSENGTQVMKDQSCFLKENKGNLGAKEYPTYKLDRDCQWVSERKFKCIKKLFCCHYKQTMLQNRT